jgi:preprotein translocase subunit SecY
MYGGSSSNIPLKLNMAGVMPVIFANSIVSIPATLGTIFPNAGWIVNLAENYFHYTKPLYVLLSVILLFAFAYFYILISFNPTEVANNIRNNGGAIPGIRPGKPTRDFIQKILNRITLIGAVFLCIVSEVPKIFVSIFETCGEFYTIFSTSKVLEAIVKFYNTGIYSSAMGYQHVFTTIAFSGTSVLIVAGVILETVRELEAQLTMRNYKGFLD